MVPPHAPGVPDSELAAALRRVIRRDRAGHRLMVAYYAIAAVVTVAGCDLAPHAAGIIIGDVIAGGVALLTGVTVAYTRARQPLLDRWGLDKQLVHPPNLKGIPKRSTQAQWHQGLGGLFYIWLLLGLAAAGGIVTLTAFSAAATAPTQVSVGTCNNAGRYHEEKCHAQWRADGRVYQGTITWTSESGSVQPGVYDPRNPSVVYDASSPWFNGLTVMLGTVVLVIAITGAVLGTQYGRRQRRPYLAAMEAKAREAAGESPQLSSHAGHPGAHGRP